MAAGVPTRKLTEDEKRLAISLAAEGRTLKAIREALGNLTPYEFLVMREKDIDFQNRLSSARAEGIEELVDSLQDIVENEPDVHRARLKAENIRWVASKRKAQVYGDRLDVNVNQTIDIGAALTEARTRAALPIFPQNSIIDAESSIIPNSSESITTDSVSVAADLQDLLT